MKWLSSFLLQPIGLIGLIGIPILILIYLIRAGYTEKSVSSTFLWDRSRRYLKKRVPIELKISAVLLLQILAIAAMSGLLSKPYAKDKDATEKVYIVDASASMLSRIEYGETVTVEQEGAPVTETTGDVTRFDRAIEKIAEDNELVDGTHRVTLITAGPTAERHGFRIDNRIDFDEELKTLTCSYGDADFEGALQYARSVQNENPNAEIFLVTDREYDTDGTMTVVNVARAEDWNAMISDVTVTKQASGFVFDATVSSYGADMEKIGIGLYLDGELIYPGTVTVKDGGETVWHATGKDIESFKTATVVLDDTLEDGIAEDNRLTVSYNEEKKKEVLYVYRDEQVPDGYLQAILRVVFGGDEGCNLVVSPYSTVEAIENYDLYVFDGYVPDELPKDGAVWLLNPKYDAQGNPAEVLGDTGITIAGAIEPGNYAITLNHQNDSEAFVTLAKSMENPNATIAMAASTFLIPDEIGSMEAILYSMESPVLLAGTYDNRRVIVTAFDFHDTNLPLMVEYPILLRNMIAYSLPSAVNKTVCEINETVSFAPPIGAKELTVRHNGGAILERELSESTTVDLDCFGDLGVYELTVGYANGDEQTFYVSSRIAEAEADLIDPGDGVLIAPDRDEEIEPVYDNKDLAPYLAALILLLILAEWGVYYYEQH